MQPASTKMITRRIKQFLCLGKGKPETYAHLHDRLGFGTVGEGVIFYAFKSFLGKQHATTEFFFGHTAASYIAESKTAERGFLANSPLPSRITTTHQDTSTAS